MQLVFALLMILALYSLIFALPSQLGKISQQLETIIQLLKEPR